MKNVTAGLITSFNALTGGAHNSFWTALNGRLFDTQAPDGAEMPFGVYFVVSEVDQDTFSENIREVYVQFSLFSNSWGSAEIKDAETALAEWLKDKVFTVTGWTVIVARRIMGSGPHVIPKDEVSGTGRHWQYDVDFEILVSKS